MFTLHNVHARKSIAKKNGTGGKIVDVTCKSGKETAFQNSTNLFISNNKHQLQHKQRRQSFKDLWFTKLS